MATKTTCREIVKKACSIFELREQLDIISIDDSIEIDQMSDATIIGEAKHVLGLFLEGGTSLSEMITADDREERKIAKSQVKALRKFLAQYA